MEDTLKTCVRCGTAKPLESFNKCRQNKDGFHKHCRQCQKEVRRIWYLKNREQEKIKSKVYNKTEKCKESRRKRWIKHKDRLSKENNERRRTDRARALAREQRRKWMQIPQNKIAVYQRSRVRQALRGIAAKATKTIELIGCTVDQLKIHLESQFRPGMTWENYGEWHVDHIIPCSSFDLARPEEQYKCFNYKNLQPLWAAENISKYNKVSV